MTDKLTATGSKLLKDFAAPVDNLTFTAAIQCVGSGGLTAHINSVWAVAV